MFLNKKSQKQTYRDALKQKLFKTFQNNFITGSIRSIRRIKFHKCSGDLTHFLISIYDWQRIWRTILTPASIYLFKVSSWNTRIMFEILLTLNRFVTLFWYFLCRLWTSKCWQVITVFLFFNSFRSPSTLKDSLVMFVVSKLQPSILCKHY